MPVLPKREDKELSIKPRVFVSYPSRLGRGSEERAGWVPELLESRHPLPTFLPSPIFLSLAALLLLTAGPLAAQQPAPATSAAAPILPDPFQLEPKADGNYLAPLLYLRPLRASYSASPLWRHDYFEELATKESFIENYAEAIADDDLAGPPPAPLTPADLETVARAEVQLKAYTAVDARQAILELAAPRQAVFINEAHHVPMDRAFTLSLLRGLYAKGFRYFAAETLDEKDTGLQQRGYPTTHSGYYIQEPVFGELVRTAIKIGYKIVPYEYTGSKSPDPIVAQNQRECGEAQNIYDRIFKHDPKAKVLVHAGYGHIAKTTATGELTSKSADAKTSSGTITFMALWFERISKIVPLSIDQSIMYEHSAPAYDSAYYQAAVADNLLPSVPVVLKNKLGHYFADPDDPAAYDLVVFHPRTLYEFGRPTWLSEDGQRQAYVLPSDLGIPANTPALVQAFYASENAAVAVPTDQIEVKPGLNPLPALMLPSGRFRLRVVDGAGKVLREWQVDRNGATP